MFRAGRALGLLTTAAAAAAMGGPGASPAAAATTAVSSNWGGYAVTGRSFRRVSGSWRVPSATCTSGSATYSASWLGLGGYADSSRSLEQTGTETDCTRAGRAVYSAWYELVPATAKPIRMTVHAGDLMSASVTVKGTHVAITLADRTTAKTFRRTLHMSKPDLSSAEWIVEAPAGCDSAGKCRELPLANFGTTAFGSARATTSKGHTGSLTDAAWSVARILLSQSGGGGSGRASVASGPGAVPSAVSSGGGGFSVAYSDSVGTSAKPVATLPAVARPAG
jgi:hypothetical protein